MTIYQFLCAMEEDARVRTVGCDSWGVRHLEELGIANAAKLEELCPADLGARLFEDERGCDVSGHRAGTCRACTRRYLELDAPEEDKEVGKSL